jgi:hypothetical protein
MAPVYGVHHISFIIQKLCVPIKNGCGYHPIHCAVHARYAIRVAGLSHGTSPATQLSLRSDCLTPAIRWPCMPLNAHPEYTTMLQSVLSEARWLSLSLSRRLWHGDKPGGLASETSRVTVILGAAVFCCDM